MNLHSDITVIFAPLNWGLGHATRSIPLIKKLIKLKCRVIICGNGNSLKLLQQEFPDNEFLVLSDYEINYTKSGFLFPLKMFLHLPKFYTSIIRDKSAAQQIFKNFKPDIIISDNRYGFYHPEAHNIFISHQLQPQLPKGIGIVKNIIYAKLNEWMNNFDEIWVPDFEDEPNLSGELSHNELKNNKIKFCGPLSRFKNNLNNENTGLPIAIVSGPEPQRTKLEDLMFEFFSKLKISAIIVGGKPEENNSFVKDGIVYYSHLNSDKLADLIINAPFVISRSGYSSIMDYYLLNKKAILIPTLGQSEQIYLAKYNAEKNCFLHAKPSLCSLNMVYKQIDSLENPTNIYNFELLEKCLSDTIFNVNALKIALS